MAKIKIDYEKVCELYSHGVDKTIISSQCNVSKTYIIQIVNKNPNNYFIKLERKQFLGLLDKKTGSNNIKNK